MTTDNGSPYLGVLVLLVLLTATGCAGSASIERTDDGRTILAVKWRGDEAPTEYIRKDAVPEPEPVTRDDLILELGKLAGDSALGAELVAIAEQAKAKQDEAARLDSLRLATWFHDREHRRRNGTGDVERRSRRAFGEID